ncbi:amino acid biosynthesis protein [Lactiplantibacillus sp. WILCCON 0030]|uniref:Amino acid biosynthesis protein n=1 Tax=Lactiplantibacillus brownii TaxID=3069269 RepID=A0ABU1A7W8_9LACO|nr:amino acid biosynthesis protein [Lactiplantibacillus brownii]MDQ7937030.1 amino acid biosynthesis protein [Lactiplantibacillus brownii]
MRLHTLGPAATDSFAAAITYQQAHPQSHFELIGHPSFETILTHLAAYAGDWLLIPAAFKSTTLQASWGDVHYALLAQLTLKDCFITQLDPLVVVQRLDADNRIGYTHAATAQLLQRIVQPVTIQTASSKYLAYQAYQQNRAAYVLTNLKNVTLTPQERLIKQLAPAMVWCVYQINEETIK